MQEVFRKIKGQKIYSVSNFGKVRNDQTGELCHTCINNCGYQIVNLKIGCKLVHRLVAETFIPNPNKLSDVNHIDSNKINNSVENLEWLSHKDNIRHMLSNEKTLERIRLINETKILFRLLNPKLKSKKLKSYKILINSIIYEDYKEACGALGVSRVTIWNWIKSGKAQKINKIKYWWDGIDEFFKYL